MGVSPAANPVRALTVRFQLLCHCKEERFLRYYGRTLRLSAAVLSLAALLRLGTGGFFSPVMEALTGQTLAGIVFFLETGRVLRPAPQVIPPAPSVPTEETSPAPQPAPPTQHTEPVLPEPDPQLLFTQQDAALVQVQSYNGYSPDVPAWLSQPLSWDLTKEEPTVLILHSHGTESYANTQTGGYRTQDVEENMISVGDTLVRLLEAKGIHALHDRTLYDATSYSDAYENARAAIKQYLQAHPSICLVLDLHRDSVTDAAGNQLRYTVPGKDQVAQLMLVVGSDASGLNHAAWPENMSLGVKLHAQLEKLCPGITRPISFRSQRFNQDLSPGALIVEVGAAGNSRQEALSAAEYLAQAVIDLRAGTK